MAELDAEDWQLDFPVLFGSGRDGYMSEDPDARSGDLKPLLKPSLSIFLAHWCLLMTLTITGRQY